MDVATNIGNKDNKLGSYYNNPLRDNDGLDQGGSGGGGEN